jgi:transcriptional regulator with XRE-family HTH domain
MEPPASKYDKEFCARIKRLREQTGMSQAQMADRLGVSQHAYEKYETRTKMPHRLMPRFAAIVQVDSDYLLTGLRSPGKPKRFA